MADTPRHTGRGIVVRGDLILLMERWRDELHYFSIPGGGIEGAETAELCAKREIMEETTLSVSVGKEVLQMHDGDTVHRIFVCEYLSGEPSLPDSAPEAEYYDANNRFKPGWIAIADLPMLDLGYWQPCKAALIAGLQNNFSDDLVIVSAAKAA